MTNIFYKKNVFNSSILDTIVEKSIDLPWCKPPSGIPGNNPPRNVCVLGDGSTIVGTITKPRQKKYLKYPKNVSYPLYQCAKNSSASYVMRPIPHTFSKIILQLRNIVKTTYKDKVIDVDNMFNVIVCNYYTEDSHQISDHRDDERWLKFNELDSDGVPSTSIIASLTFYVDEEPSILRNFEIYDDAKNSWNKYQLEHNSLVLFSNHRHRAKHVGKRGQSCKRINLTFRTLTSGLLGLTGYGNFYRYMSIPEKIFLSQKNNMDIVTHFYKSIEYSNNFNQNTYFTDIDVIRIDQDKVKAAKSKIRDIYLKFLGPDLPRYVKSLCTLYNYINYIKFIETKRFVVKRDSQ